MSKQGKNQVPVPTNVIIVVTLNDHDDTLPPCPKCHETEYTP